jgi:tRNA threonylcarbamoyladenosine biosynthesis protein TsaB
MSLGLTLALDGSTYAGTVAVISELDVAAARELPAAGTPGRAGREEGFMPMLAACLDEAGVEPGQIERVVCGAGPGSFTSLRVAASIAKGLASGTGCPLFAVSSLKLAVAGLSAGRYLATLPAMRGELFASLFEVGEEGRVTELGLPAIITAALQSSEAERLSAVHIHAVPHARGAAQLLPDIIAGGACDLDSWEPLYGRLAEAQVRWEAAHGRPLTATG